MKLGGAFPIQTWNSVTFSEKGHACLAGFDGTILICSGGAALKAVQASTIQGAKSAKVFSLDTYRGGIIAGMSDKSLVVFDSKLAVVKRLNFDFKVTAVHVREKDVVVGTQGAQIYYLKNALSDEVEGGPVAGRFEPLTAGHSDGELWAQTISADGTRAFTAGEDNQILQWDLTGHKLIRRDIITSKKGTAPKVRKAATTSLHPQVQCCRALALSPHGGAHLAAATNDGSLTVFSTSDMTVLAHVNLNPHGQRKVTNQEGNWTQTMEYSPNGEHLAVGTHGSVICILDVAAGYKVVGKINAHHAFLTHMDWSTDSTMLRANDGVRMRAQRTHAHMHAQTAHTRTHVARLGSAVFLLFGDDSFLIRVSLSLLRVFFFCCWCAFSKQPGVRAAVPLAGGPPRASPDHLGLEREGRGVGQQPLCFLLDLRGHRAGVGRRIRQQRGSPPRRVAPGLGQR